MVLPPLFGCGLSAGRLPAIKSITSTYSPPHSDEGQSTRYTYNVRRQGIATIMKQQTLLFAPFFVLLSALWSSSTSGLSTHPTKQQALPRHAFINRRDAFSSIIAISGSAAAFLPTLPTSAAEDNQVLSDEEMEARIARKMELLRSAKSSTDGPKGKATDIRSDINPEAAVNLRSRSAIENAKIAMEKQQELKNRDKAQKRGT